MYNKSIFVVFAAMSLNCGMPDRDPSGDAATADDSADPADVLLAPDACPSGLSACPSANYGPNALQCRDLQTESDNCGSCGNNCWGGTCTNGVCTSCAPPGEPIYGLHVLCGTQCLSGVYLSTIQTIGGTSPVPAVQHHCGACEIDCGNGFCVTDFTETDGGSTTIAYCVQ